MGEINMDAVTLEDLLFLYENYNVTCEIASGHVTKLLDRK